MDILLFGLQKTLTTTAKYNIVNVYCPLAQLVEQATVNRWVRGSSPRGAAI